MHTENYTYHHGKQALLGFLAYQGEMGKRPAVLIVHDWSGRNTFACQKAELLATMGYVGFAVDMYGEGRVGETNEEKKALIQPFYDDRQLLLDRIQAGLSTLRSIDVVDKTQIAVIGFCFGGLCALDLARSGADILGVVSFHGLLGKPTDVASYPIKAKVLALHGYDDPMVNPEQVQTFCQEMSAAGADWQINMYGNTQHAFTNPLAHDKTLGLVYSDKAERRSHQAMINFLNELFL